MYTFFTESNDSFLVYQQLLYDSVPGLKRCISRKFGAVEARDSAVFVPNPEEFLGRVEGHGLGLRREGILPRGNEQAPDLGGESSVY